MAWKRQKRQSTGLFDIPSRRDEDDDTSGLGGQAGDSGLFGGPGHSSGLFDAPDRAPGEMPGLFDRPGRAGRPGRPDKPAVGLFDKPRPRRGDRRD